MSWTGSNGVLNVSTAGDTGISLSTCTGLSWSAFDAVVPPPPLPTPRFTLVSATIAAPVQHGDSIDFTVRLFNGDTRALELASPQCPDYSETVEDGGALAAKGVYQLNCSGIDIPAQGAVDFGMRLQLGRSVKGPARLIWILEDAVGQTTVVRAEATVVVT